MLRNSHFHHFISRTYDNNEHFSLLVSQPGFLLFQPLSILNFTYNAIDSFFYVKIFLKTITFLNMEDILITFTIITNLMFSKTKFKCIL